MKLTKEQKRIFVERHNEWLKEGGIFGNLFAKGVANWLRKDKDLDKAIEDTEKSLKNTRDKIEKRTGGDKEQIKKSLSPEVRKALGFDY